MRIIPAIDIIDGQCVRLSQGNYDIKKIYDNDPLEVAKRFENDGIQYLHLVDLDGAKARQVVHYQILERIATQTKLCIDFGGGIQSDSDIQLAFNSGAKQVNIGSIAVSKPDLMLQWLQTYGSERIILSADCRQRMVALHGWQADSELDVISFIQQYEKQGVRYCTVTDIEKDGMLNGPATELYEDILSKTEVQLIASGGVTTVEDIKRLKQLGCDGVIIGKAIYDGTLKLQELIP